MNRDEMIYTQTDATKFGKADSVMHDLGDLASSPDGKGQGLFRS